MTVTYLYKIYSNVLYIVLIYLPNCICQMNANSVIFAAELRFYFGITLQEVATVHVHVSAFLRMMAWRHYTGCRPVLSSATPTRYGTNIIFINLGFVLTKENKLFFTETQRNFPSHVSLSSDRL